MKWSFKLGRFLGIDVYIHLTFLLLLAFIGMAHWMAGADLGAALSGVLFFVGIFFCVLLHEYGHALMARRFGIGTRDITLLPFGGVAQLERMPDKPAQELWVALAGPAVNVVIAAGLGFWLYLTGTWEPLAALGPVDGNLIERLMSVNIFLVLFNMLPAFPMDGGRVLRALLAMRLDYTRATNIAATVGKVMAGIFAVLGFLGNPMLLVIAFFVWSGATHEAAATELKSGLAGAAVRDAMVTDFVAVTPEATLNDVSLLVLSGSQEDFPVVSNGKLVGLLTHADIMEAIRTRSPDEPVSDVMRTTFVTAEEGEDLNEVISYLHETEGLPLPVMRRGRLSGMLTAQNIEEYNRIRRGRLVRLRATPRARTILYFPSADSLRFPSRS
jgi:Zn-dependent protease/CBS domain-containing protein